MSATEIFTELPKLTFAERSIVRRRLREFAERDEGHFLHEAADSMFQDMDKPDAKNSRRKTRQVRRCFQTLDLLGFLEQRLNARRPDAVGKSGST